ncbi:hypothetical protein [Paraburkholderia rhizosphaerae]|uniref:Uncharacterized protein n=1 Tax=Paraburkholderia rhizosphaerae TaxID=480658 RepID=A0A4R8LW85_9BURK|nr:hypothetical protein [Paraburkholderia rhizosphaerae]TDY50956.1 hypothetical protein BX592_108193 [Paraburkholderia rhizosphaerae]
MSNANSACALSTVTAQPALTAGASGELPIFDEPDALLELARDAGMLVLLDAQIGREKYQSVVGSLASLRRFAASVGNRPRECDPA